MIRSNKGLTLVELLCTMVIMLMVFGAVSVGVRQAADSYVRSISVSESEVLCTTVLDAVSDELRFAVFTDWKNTHFQSQRYSGTRTFTVDNGKVLVSRVDEEGSDKLLPNQSYPNGLKVKLTLEPSAARTDGIIAVTVEVTDAKGAKLIARSRDVKILNAAAVTPAA